MFNFFLILENVCQFSEETPSAEVVTVAEVHHQPMVVFASETPPTMPLAVNTPLEQIVKQGTKKNPVRGSPCEIST